LGRPQDRAALCSLRMSKSENKCYKILRAVINAQHNTGEYFTGGN